MTALLEAPAPVTAADAPRRGSRRPAAALAALLVVAGVLGSLALWAPSSVALTAGTTTSTGAADVVTVPGYGPRGTHVVDYQHGRQVELVVPVRNDGPLPLRITAASAGAQVLPLLELTATGLPITVRPGGTADLVLQGVLDHCAYYHERQVQLLDGLDVETAVLGLLPTARTVPFDRPLLVHSPMIVGCPDRTLTRNDDRRLPDPSRL